MKYQRANRGLAARVSPLLGALAIAAALDARALPEGMSVRAGEVTANRTASELRIRQGSDRAIIDWQSFSIDANGRVRFDQSSVDAVALNRVTGSSLSEIHGSLRANGKVFLVNPSGIYFGAGSRVDVGGLVASTLSISDTDFLAGEYRFVGDGGPVVNHGRIEASNVALLGRRVANHGRIKARAGTVALAAGDQMTLSFDDGLSVMIDDETLEAMEADNQAIRAGNGEVVMTAATARALESRMVAGGEAGADELEVSADGAFRLLAGGEMEAREIALDAGPHGKASVTGRLDVSSAHGAGGRVTVQGRHIALAHTARIDATGATGGGDVLIGGDWQGGDHAEYRVFNDPEALREAVSVDM
ncbi:two-partner secretion domain-containing protein, partial [Spiribacter pallidus]